MSIHRAIHAPLTSLTAPTLSDSKIRSRKNSTHSHTEYVLEYIVRRTVKNPSLKCFDKRKGQSPEHEMVELEHHSPAIFSGYTGKDGETKT